MELPIFVRVGYKQSPKNSGFTFMELLVTLAIVSILAVSSIFSARFLLTNSRLKSAADSFASQIRLARSEAIQRQQDVYLNLIPGSSWCYGINEGASCSCSPSNDCGLGMVSGSEYSSVTTATSGFTSNNIYFDSVRGLPSSSASIDFSLSGKTITVSISSLGQVAVCSDDIVGYPTC